MKNTLTKRQIIAMVFTSIYIILMSIALLSSPFLGLPSILIILGCLINLIYMVVLKRSNRISLLIIGMICISISAVLIGIQQGGIQVIHHIIRTIFELVIILLFSPTKG